MARLCHVFLPKEPSVVTRYELCINRSLVQVLSFAGRRRAAQEHPPAKFISVNPVRTGYSAIADQWIGIRPGTDGLCLNRIWKLPRGRPVGYRDARN
jgi:hypothetical protein